MTLPSEALRRAILESIRGGATRPTELLGVLGDRFSDFEIKEGLLRLLQEGVVELSSDRHVRIAEAA
jgi:hypothetical protein